MDAIAYLGKLVKEKRLEKKLSQMDLFQLTGIYQPAISRIENGSENIRFKHILLLSKHLGFSLAEFDKF